MNTLDLLDIATAIVPERTAFVSGESGGGRRASFASIRCRAARLAGGMNEMGVSRGDRVAMMNVNCQEFAEAYFACAMLDAVFVPFNFRARPPEIAWMLREVGAKVVVAGRRYCATVDAARVEARLPARGIAIGGPPRAQGLWLDYEQVIASSRSLARSPRAADGDPAMVMFTSGTSARPKGVVLTHSSFCEFVMANVEPADPDDSPVERTILTVPLYHIAGAQALMAGVYGGRTLILQPQFEPEEWMGLVQQHRASRAMLVPTMLKGLVNHPRFDDYDLSSLAVITYGAAAMPGEVLMKALARFPQAQFINAFGQTETAATVTMLSPEDHVLKGSPEEVAKKRARLRSIGRPLPDVEVRIVDEKGQALPSGEVGEIVARGPRLMKGYWNQPEATAAALQDGWLHTGDTGWQDEDGYIFLTGRTREFIKRGGEMISPEEVEETLERHGAVAEAAVIGVPDAAWGEVVHAVVALVPGRSVSAQELIEFCRARIASFKKPERVHFVERLPRNQLGKIMRGELRARFRPGGG